MTIRFKACLMAALCVGLMGNLHAKAFGGERTPHTDTTASADKPGSTPTVAPSGASQPDAVASNPQAHDPDKSAKPQPCAPDKHTSWGKWLISALFSLLLLTPLTMPLVRYLTQGWQAKRKDIMDGLSPQARKRYFMMFCRGESHDNEPIAEAKTRFEALYTHWYGRRLYICPGILLALIGLTACVLVTFSVLKDRDYLTDNPLFQLAPTAIAAIAGAYLWAVNDLISRARRLDMAPANVQLAALRFVIAVPMGYAFGSLATDSIQPFIAFALGAFPLDALTSMLRRLANKKLDITPEGDEIRDDIVKLQGINRPIVERLADEDITTVTQIAYCDPVRLVMRSNLTFNFVTDCMNQALVFMYFDGMLEKLRPLGMRGAVEVKHLVDDLDNELDQDRDAQKACVRAKATLKEMARILSLEEDAIQVTLRQIAEDPFTIFLYEMWT